MLDAGIDVFSTVNVQHLESLNDQVAQLTGTRVRETIPDEVLSAADEVVLIDLTPEALIARLRAGKVYPPERVQAALNNFFKIENLAALRETALRQVAEDVEVKRLVQRARRPSCAATRRACAAAPRRQPQAIAERLLALATLAPESERVVRRAWRSAQRLDASSTCSSCARPGARRAPRTASGWRRCAGSSRCSARACAWRRARTSPRSRSPSARELGSTYVLMGTPSAAPRHRPAAPAAAATRRDRSLLDAPAARAARRRRAHRRRPDAARRTGGRGRCAARAAGATERRLQEA